MQTGNLAAESSLEVDFHPEWSDSQLVAAVREYRNIWTAHGSSIVEVLERRARLRFVETMINALVCEYPSRARPLILRASYPKNVKCSTLVHELGHRILSGNGYRTTPGEKSSFVNAHKLLFLFLFDAYVELFGEKMAQQAVEFESSLGPSYKGCWQWALDLDQAERAIRFADIKRHKEAWTSHLEILDATRISHRSNASRPSSP